ncbi:MAG: hypothetical protein LBB43_06170 [Spirochaetaceae bacterium]|jgi:lipopolysaccharide export LptBFGC system permease protein LptF|nr:hypothetical protein [Spirochaetaceae bacterium]
MRKRMLFSVLIVTYNISALVFAVPTDGVAWSWNGGDTITAKSTDGKEHLLEVAITVTNKGHTSCVNTDIKVPAKSNDKNPAIWDVKDKIGKNATIDSVSVTGCK